MFTFRTGYRVLFCGIEMFQYTRYLNVIAIFNQKLYFRRSGRGPPINVRVPQ